MAYSKAELERLSLEIIEEDNAIFISDVIELLPISEKTFYNYKIQEIQAIKKALARNKIKTKSRLRKRWEESEAPATQIALYKILANEKESDALNGNNHKDKNININLPKGVEIELEDE